LLASFTGQVHWTEKLGREKFLKAVADALAICVDGGLVRAASEGGLSASKVGKVAAGRSMGAKTAITFAQWAKEPHAGPPAPLEVLTLLGLTVAGAGVYVRLTWKEDRDSSYKGDLLARIDSAGLQQRAVFAPFTSTRMAMEAEVKDIVTRSVSGHATEKMQERYSTVFQAEMRSGIAKIISLAGVRAAMESDEATSAARPGMHRGMHGDEMKKAS
jgi:hypothetical protein